MIAYDCEKLHTPTNAPLKLLVLCTGNSCRSIMAEALINSLGGDRIVAYSAGSKPAGFVNPNAIRKLRNEGIDVADYQSKSWDEFSSVDAPPIDIVITVCDNAAGESCPFWNGSPVTVHWGITDPAIAVNDPIETAFNTAFEQLRTRIVQMLELPLEEFDPRMRRESLQRIHDSVSAGERDDA